MKLYISCRSIKQSTFFSAALAILMVFVGTIAGFSLERSEKITILYTNDTHSHLLPFNLPGMGKNIGGIGRRYSLIKALRKENPCLLLLDGGDIFQGTPFFSFFKGEADVMTFSQCGYEATTLGNHELDDGLKNIIDQFHFSTFPIICSNVKYKETQKLIFEPLKIIEKGGWRIGITGVIGKIAWDVIPNKYRDGLEMIDPEIALPEVLHQLATSCDLRILLSHSGYESDLQLAEKFPEIDLIIGGHTNTTLEKPVLVAKNPKLVTATPENGIGGTLVVQAFKWGVFLGKLDLKMDQSGKISSYSGELLKITASITEELGSPVSKAVCGFESSFRLFTSQVIGSLQSEMTYPEDQKHVRDLPLGRFTCDAMMDFTHADLAIINSGSIRSPLPQGSITMDNVFSAYPFENTIVVLSIKGKEILEMLTYLCETADQKLSGFQFGGVTGLFDHLEKKAINVSINGVPIELEKDYKLVTISYLIEGNLQAKEMFKAAKNITDTGFLMREAVIESFRKNKSLTPPPADQIIYKLTPLEMKKK
ncbi:MAG: bifunctional metallophosphatase/5'-nucleotidase [Candidatus Riflebacteria bacterium]|nr:bifunctional metallophosphatase/5'-nucleotidase [Candidatus Riflebacteria bacterium]